MIKSAATILAEIEETAPERPRPKGRRRRTVSLDAYEVERANRLARVTALEVLGVTPPRKPRPKPRPDRRERSIDREADARAYRLAAIEHGVHPLLPRNLYSRTTPRSTP